MGQGGIPHDSERETSAACLGGMMAEGAEPVGEVKGEVGWHGEHRGAVVAVTWYGRHDRKTAVAGQRYETLSEWQIRVGDDGSGQAAVASPAHASLGRVVQCPGVFQDLETSGDSPRSHLSGAGHNHHR